MQCSVVQSSTVKPGDVICMVWLGMAWFGKLMFSIDNVAQNPKPGSVESRVKQFRLGWYHNQRIPRHHIHQIMCDYRIIQ